MPRRMAEVDDEVVLVVVGIGSLHRYRSDGDPPCLVPHVSPLRAEPFQKILQNPVDLLQGVGGPLIRWCLSFGEELFWQGNIQNFGPGNLFVAVAANPTDVTPGEIEILPNGNFGWQADDGYEILIMYIRSDNAVTQYQVIAG